MPSTRPLQWIEQAEARDMMTDAMFRQPPTSANRKRGREAIMEALMNAFSYIMPAQPMPQLRPALVRQQDRRQRVPRCDDYR